jgi:hypothetical protein
MQTPSAGEFILIGSATEGGTVFICESGPDRTVWTAYDIQSGGARTNPRVVSGKSAANWRGVPELP